MNRFVKIFIVVIVLAFVVALIVSYNKPQQKKESIKIAGTYLTTAHDVTDFKLSASNGHVFTKESLKGHWTLMFFGFTNCGSVCPTTMAALSAMYKALDKDLSKEEMPQIIMVSVDPERDTVSRMREYVAAFDPHFIGARADMAETTALEKQFYIAAAKLQADGAGSGHYTINHSADILVFNPKAQIQAYLSFPPDAKQLVKDYKLMLKSA